MKKSQNIDYQYDRLVNILQSGYANLQGILVAQLGNNYWLFGRYTLQKQASGFLITDQLSDRSLNFGRLRHAVTWATLDNLLQLPQALRVIQLDQLISGLELETALVARRVKKAATIDQYSTAMIKQSTLQDRLNRNQTEMHKYIMIARQWQIRELENATKRNEHKSVTNGTSRSKRTV